jgi:hypothetical protein
MLHCHFFYAVIREKSTSEELARNEIRNDKSGMISLDIVMRNMLSYQYHTTLSMNFALSLRTKLI